MLNVIVGIFLIIFGVAVMVGAIRLARGYGAVFGIPTGIFLENFAKLATCINL